MDQGRGEDAGQHPGDSLDDVVEDDSGEHAAEEESGIVVVDVEDSTHGPEWNVVETPAEEEPGAGHQSCLSLSSKIWSLGHAALSLETGVAVHEEEEEEEDNVAPPDDRVSEQEYPLLVIAS